MLVLVLVLRPVEILLVRAVACINVDEPLNEPVEAELTQGVGEAKQAGDLRVGHRNLFHDLVRV